MPSFSRKVVEARDACCQHDPPSRSEADLQLVATSTSDSSIRKTASDNIDRELLRATQLRTTLRGFGVFWRSNGDYPNKEVLWHCSFRCERIRFFLSHSWAANGTLKFLTLLLHSEMWIAASAFILSWISLYILTVDGFLPSLGFYETTIRKTTYVCPMYFWSSSLAPMIALGVLFISPVLPCSCRNTPVFLDMLCIHQVNKELKMKGISSLGGFLANSDDFLMLWSKQYFSRLWCVFEVAAFRHYRRDGKIIVRPTSIVFAHLLGFVIAWVITNSIQYAFTVFNLEANFLMLLGVCFSFMILCLGQTPLRTAMRDKLALRNQLLSFDCRKAACFDPADRAYIIKAIQRWSGSEESFNAHVRGAMRETLECDFFARPVSYSASFVVGLPLSLSAFDYLPSFYNAGVPQQDVISSGVLFSIYMFGVWPLSFWSMYYLAERFYLPRNSSIGELGLNVALSSCTAIGAVSLQYLGALSVKSVDAHVMPMPVFLYGAFVATLVCLVFWLYPKYRARHIESWFSKFQTSECDFSSTSGITLGAKNMKTAESKESADSRDEVWSDRSHIYAGALARKFSL